MNEGVTRGKWWKASKIGEGGGERFPIFSKINVFVPGRVFLLGVLSAQKVLFATLMFLLYISNVDVLV